MKDDRDPFTRCFERRPLGSDEGAYRLRLAQRYSYVLPEPYLVDVVARYAPLVEMGAGTGYWAHRLRLMGADVLAYDQVPPGGARENRYHPRRVRPWTEVLEGDLTILPGHHDRTLFLCWPPRFSALWECLRFWSGATIIYVGDRGPRTARLPGLEEGFQELEAHPVLAMDPEPGRPARLAVWRRKGRNDRDRQLIGRPL